MIRGSFAKDTVVKQGLYVTEAIIRTAYIHREKEIKSLLEYDRGEKKINAPDLRKFVESL